MESIVAVSQGGAIASFRGPAGEFIGIGVVGLAPNSQAALNMSLTVRHTGLPVDSMGVVGERNSQPSVYVLFEANRRLELRKTDGVGKGARYCDTDVSEFEAWWLVHLLDASTPKG